MSPRQAVLLVVGVVAVSFSAIFIRLADAPPLAIAFYRNAFAAAVLVPLVAVRQRDELRRLERRHAGVAVLAGAILAVHFATWITSLSLTTIAASVVLVTASPIFVAAASKTIYGERTTAATLAGILVGLVGAAVVSGGDFAISVRAAGGDLLALAGAAAAGAYFVAGRHVRRDVSLLSYVTLVYTSCAVVLLPFAVVTGTALTGFSLETWLLFAAMAVVPQLLGHSIFNYLLKDVDPTTVAVAVMGEPIGSTLLALAFFGEVPPWTAVAGGVLILAGIYVAVTAQARARDAAVGGLPTG